MKLNGRAGKWNLAFLDVQTRETTVPSDVVQDLGLPSAVVPGTSLLASRVSYDVNENLRIGTIVTNGDPEALRRNTLAGFDAVWRTSKFHGNKNFCWMSGQPLPRAMLVLAASWDGALEPITPTISSIAAST